MGSPSISVITVTLNCAQRLPRLLDSLLAQKDQDFEWVVVDGGSRDNTLEVVSRFPEARLRKASGPDFGIYDALNKAVALARGDYYVVAGADDELYPDAIGNFRRTAASTSSDIVAASVDWDASTLRPMRGRRWLRGGNAFVAGHAVGSLIRRRLHETCGMYSNRYVNTADMYFVLSAHRAGARIGAADFVAGRFGTDGVSSTDQFCSLSDAFRIQLAFGENKPLQLALYIARLLRALWRSR
jgi:glycosyltransferase involved in cell wall biosynthesis